MAASSDRCGERVLKPSMGSGSAFNNLWVGVERLSFTDLGGFVDRPVRRPDELLSRLARELPLALTQNGCRGIRQALPIIGVTLPERPVGRRVAVSSSVSVDLEPTNRAVDAVSCAKRWRVDAVRVDVERSEGATEGIEI